MQSLTSKPFVTLFTIFLLSSSLSVLAQISTGGRNITIPTTSTTTAPSSTQTPSTGNNNNNNNSTANNSTAGNHTTTSTSNNSTQNSTTSTPTKLTPIPDATGTAGNVPVPAATGGKPNGRYGPDDQYIAGFPKLAIPFFSTLFIMSSTVVILTYGAML